MRSDYVDHTSDIYESNRNSCIECSKNLCFTDKYNVEWGIQNFGKVGCPYGYRRYYIFQLYILQC